MSNRSASCTARGSLRVVVVLGFLLLCSISMNAQNRRCPDPTDDSHFTVLYETSKVRVLALELGRLQSTTLHCMRSNYLSIVTTDSRTTTALEGTAGFDYEWSPGEARFHHTPRPQVIRNETSLPHRAVFIETSAPVPYNPLDGVYNTDAFESDLNELKPTFATSLTRGPLRATRIQLAPADSIQLISADHVVIALSDVVLKRSDDAIMRLDRYDAAILKVGDTNKLTNDTRTPARFIIVDF